MEEKESKVRKWPLIIQIPTLAIWLINLVRPWVLPALTLYGLVYLLSLAVGITGIVYHRKHEDRLGKLKNWIFGLSVVNTGIGGFALFSAIVLFLLYSNGPVV